jgi:hypothetical protein
MPETFVLSYARGPLCIAPESRSLPLAEGSDEWRKQPGGICSVIVPIPYKVVSTNANTVLFLSIAKLLLGTAKDKV